MFLPHQVCFILLILKALVFSIAYYQEKVRHLTQLQWLGGWCLDSLKLFSCSLHLIKGVNSRILLPLQLMSSSPEQTNEEGILSSCNLFLAYYPKAKRNC